jgi:hypothetical protein
MSLLLGTRRRISNLDILKIMFMKAEGNIGIAEQFDLDNEIIAKRSDKKNCVARRIHNRELAMPSDVGQFGFVCWDLFVTPGAVDFDTFDNDSVSEADSMGQSVGEPKDGLV